MCSLSLMVGVLLRECPSPSRQPGWSMVGSACAFHSGQLGSAWAHDCAVGDEEVAEDQDESCGHGGWDGVADVASCLNGMLSEVE
jgi:hypothetical protein